MKKRLCLKIIEIPSFSHRSGRGERILSINLTHHRKRMQRASHFQMVFTIIIRFAI
ncbi:MAG: hypothetical protein LBR79_06420 [Oscillospiraceae bacterium]|nr:hypothetical protein [Oscillospiraceae bacterium]